MKIKFKKLSEKAVTPTKAHASDGGFDLTATSRAVRPYYIEYGTHLSVSVPEGYIGLLFPRSSVSDKPLNLANSVGVLDPGYQGEVKLRFRKTIGAAIHTDSESELYRIGDRIGQLVILELPKFELEEVENFTTKTDRGTGSFGSSNKKKTSKKVIKKVDIEDDK